VRLARLNIENLRSVANATVDLGPYTCLVGPNGAGKSTILTALNILFRNASDSPIDLLSLSEEDFHKKDITVPITITATFVDLEPEAAGDFKHYVRQGGLVLSARATWDQTTKKATVRQFGQRFVMKAFAPFFRASDEGRLVGDLKAIYATIRGDYPDLPPPTTKVAMTDALRQFEEANPDACSLEESTDEFYGVSKGRNLLQKYVQWVYLPAVKDASTEQVEGKKTALGQLLERVVRSRVSFDEPIGRIREDAQDRYAKVLREREQVLAGISDSLNARLQRWAHPDASLAVKWYENPGAVRVDLPMAHMLAGEGTFLGAISRCGHGLQRSFLLALLQELASAESAGAPTLILGCEEPELYQHPPQQRHLAEVLEKLTEENAQVLVSTHSPHFVSGRGFESVRMVRKDRASQATKVRGITFTELAKTVGKARGEVLRASALPPRMHQLLSPSVNEMFFSPVVVLVEGAEDVAYLSTYMILSGRWEDFRRAGCHIVPVEGKTKLVETIAIAGDLEIPTFAVCDADSDETNPGHREKHRKDNEAIQRLLNVDPVDGLPSTTLWNRRLVMWSTEIGQVVESEIGSTRFKELYDKVIDDHDLHGRGSLKKNGLVIGYLLWEAWAQEMRIPSLERTCGLLLDFAQSAAVAAATAAA
jgi:energy-coupling factor transporter ATP-binding protein EcfA2